MKNVGWIKLHRKMLDWSLCDTPAAFNLYCHLLLMAAYEDFKYKGILVKRGEIFTTIKKLEVVTGLSTKAIRNALDILEEEGCIKCIGANKGHTITICNFDSYQADEEAQGQTKGTLKGTIKDTLKDTLKGTMKGQTPIYNVYKEDKEIEEYKEEKEIKEERENARAEIVEPYEYIFIGIRDFYEKKLNSFYVPGNNDAAEAFELHEKMKMYRQLYPMQDNYSDVNFFKYFLLFAYQSADEWVKDNFNIHTLNSQFNTIKNKIDNQKTKENGKQRNSKDDGIEAMLREHAKLAAAELKERGIIL